MTGFEPLAIGGQTPLIVSLPHVGTGVPPSLRGRLTPAALKLADTDWHVERLYAFAREAGASWLEARVSRYVIDLNRPPDDATLYPGQVATGLCPHASFDGEALYRDAGPGADEVASRRVLYWEPYHNSLASLLAAAQARHGYAVLLDAHSIKSRVPRLFEGRLPDINLGTFDGRACDASLAAALGAPLGRQQRFSHTVDGRFKGGYITRHYGRPAERVHALQIELAQAAYMDETANAYSAQSAAPLEALLKEIVAVLSSWRPTAGARH